jgi:hypothetical protein
MIIYNASCKKKSNDVVIMNSTSKFVVEVVCDKNIVLS